jgi:flavin-dependent dehydrogenase
VKVAVVGGSVAGLSAANFLLSSGLDCEVSIIERKKAFGDKIVCAGGIASFMIKKLQLQVPDEFIARKVQRVRFYSPNLDYADLELHKEYGLILWRDRWEKWLGQQVEELGAKVHLDIKDSAEMLKDADVIVGADGLTGVSRRLVGKPFPSSGDVHMGIQAVGKTKFADEEAISLFFGRWIPEGYGWLFPLQGGEFRIGLGVPLTYASNLQRYFDTFVTSVEAELSEKPKVKMIPTAPPEKTLVGNAMGKPIAFVGDAGLMCDPATGGGIAPAILGAKCLAESLGKGNLNLYDKLWKAELYRKNKQRYGLKQVLCELSDAEWEKLVDLLKDFRPISESIGLALMHLLAELAFKEPRFLTRHKILRRLLKL